MEFRDQFVKCIEEFDNILGLIKSKQIRNIEELEKFIDDERDKLVLLLQKIDIKRKKIDKKKKKRVLEVINRFGSNGEISISNLMNHTHIRKRDLSDVLEILEGTDELIVEKIKRKIIIRLIKKDK